MNWDKISQAINFYQSEGFTYVDTPWVVPLDTLQLTTTKVLISTPEYGKKFGLVGSAEQGFIQLGMEGKLNSTIKYVSAGPCFRTDTPDFLHQSYFFKVELFAMCNSEEQASQTAIEFRDIAMSVMPAAYPIETDIGWDLEVNYIEVGSYGIRNISKIGWVAYGTGLAEPRYSTANQAKWRDRYGNKV